MTNNFLEISKCEYIFYSITRTHVLDKINTLKEKIGEESYQPRSVLESLLFKNENSQTAVIMAMDMLMAGVDTVILLVHKRASVKLSFHFVNLAFLFRRPMLRPLLFIIFQKILTSRKNYLTRLKHFYRPRALPSQRKF